MESEQDKPVPPLEAIAKADELRAELMEEATSTTYGAALRAERKAKGWSQVELAEKIGTSQQNVGHWEAGRTVPRIAMHEKLLVLFGRDSPLAALTPRGVIPLNGAVDFTRRYRTMLEAQRLAELREGSGLPEIDLDTLMPQTSLRMGVDRIKTGRELVEATAKRLAAKHECHLEMSAPGFKNTRIDMMVGDMLVEFKVAVGRDLESAADRAFFTLETFARALERVERRMLGEDYKPRRKMLIFFGPAIDYVGTEQADTVLRKSDLYDIDVAICPDVDRAVDHIERVLGKI